MRSAGNSERMRPARASKLQKHEQEQMGRSFDTEQTMGFTSLYSFHSALFRCYPHAAMYGMMSLKIVPFGWATSRLKAAKDSLFLSLLSVGSIDQSPIELNCHLQFVQSHPWSVDRGGGSGEGRQCAMTMDATATRRSERPAPLLCASLPPPPQAHSSCDGPVQCSAAAVRGSAIDSSQGSMLAAQ